MEEGEEVAEVAEVVDGAAAAKEEEIGTGIGGGRPRTIRRNCSS